MFTLKDIEQKMAKLSVLINSDAEMANKFNTFAQPLIDTIIKDFDIKRVEDVHANRDGISVVIFNGTQSFSDSKQSNRMAGLLIMYTMLEKLDSTVH